MKKYDVIIIGGGLYGSLLALHLKKKYSNVLLIEKEAKLLTKASYYNQARVHNGYHYPRSFITALRSHQNFLQFCKDFKPAIVKKFPSFYAIARHNSKVNAQQFEKFCNLIKMPVRIAPISVKKLFNQDLIEEVFAVEEFEFNATILRKNIHQKIKKNQIDLWFNSEVIKVETSVNDFISIHLQNGEQVIGSKVLNCTYAGINTILQQSNLPLIPIKYEYTEMPLIHLPLPFKKYGITIMDGPFFSILPFPDKQMHSLHHVRYTPRMSWFGTDEDFDKQKISTSAFRFMAKDVIRYLPGLNALISSESLFQSKAVLQVTENNDGRPIYYHKNYGIANFHLILGGKIDNVYDIIEEIESQGL